jgi:Fe-S cluster assembly protein SufB
VAHHLNKEDMKQSVSKDSKLETGYKYGFTTDIESEQIPKGINEDTVRLISSIKKEPK